jgi:hypothetical protein
MDKDRIKGSAEQAGRTICCQQFSRTFSYNLPNKGRTIISSFVSSMTLCACRVCSFSSRA